MCFKHWVSDNGEDSSVIHPGSGRCDIEVFTGKETIHGKYEPPHKYYVELIVYENGFFGSNAGKNFEASVPENPEKSC